MHMHNYAVWERNNISISNAERVGGREEKGRGIEEEREKGREGQRRGRVSGRAMRRTVASEGNGHALLYHLFC